MLTEYNDRTELREQFLRLIDDSTDIEKMEFLSELHNRGETANDIVQLAEILREKALLGRVNGVTDIVGTGGDGKNTINVSTAASILVSSVGVAVAKHGNFGATSNRGSADFLKYLGYNFEMEQKEFERRIRKNSFAFILAPRFNENFAKFAAPRKKLPFRTVFNYLGPLTNPADPDTMVLGVSDPIVGNLYADFLAINSKSGYVVHSDDGMDEVSPYSPSRLIEVSCGSKTETTFEPSELLGGKIELDKISAVSPEDSFRLTEDGLSGRNENASKFIALNAALSLVSNGKYQHLEDGYREAMCLLKSGYVMEHLGNIIEDSR